MSKHNYTNPAFCQGSEFYPVPSALRAESTGNVEAIYNRSLNSNYGATGTRGGTGRSIQNGVTNGPLRIHRTMSTRSVRSTSQKVVLNPQQLQQQHGEAYRHNATLQDTQISIHNQNSRLNRTVEAFDSRSVTGSGRYALVPVEELAASTTGTNGRYAILPAATLAAAKRYAKSQDNLDRYSSRPRLRSDEEPHSYHEENSEQFTSLPPVFSTEKLSHQHQHPQHQHQRNDIPPPVPPKIKHAFSSDFGSKSFLLVDKNSNQRYQMVPTAEDEEIVDDNQEIIQMHNGRAHRYACIPTEDEYDEDGAPEEEETCLSTSDLHQSQHFLTQNIGGRSERTPLRTSTPQKGVSMGNLVGGSYPGTPLKNPAATKMLHELLSTPRKMTPTALRGAQTTPRKIAGREHFEHQHQLQQQQQQHQRHQSTQQMYYIPTGPKKELSPQRLHYETIKPVVMSAAVSTASIHMQSDRTTAVITPRVASGTRVHPQIIVEEDSTSIQTKSINNNSYPQKVTNATITLAVISLMLVLGSTMNSGLIIYMIAHFGKSFYLQFSLVAAFCGVGLGFLGFRSRHCEWLPNRSYISGYILVTVFCLLKCCGLLVILVFDPYPGLPLHDVTTGIILGLSTFTMFFIGLGVIGSLWCYRPPPDNRVNVV